ncbi:MAG: 30S ribosomal protein S13 [Nanoarchaeota archaeon]|nr:30S ribosomal protein S13 [Nanoarchaeota archaeon]
MSGKKPEQGLKEEVLVRIMATDIPGSKNIYTGLTRIKGVSWSFSNAICNVLKIEKTKKVSEITKEEIEKITKFVESPKLPEYILNRQKDRESGDSVHLNTSKLDLKKEFDIKRLKKIRSYRGLRHSLGQPTRGQRTRSHFRKKGRAVGVKKKR